MLPTRGPQLTHELPAGIPALFPRPFLPLHHQPIKKHTPLHLPTVVKSREKTWARKREVRKKVVSSSTRACAFHPTPAPSGPRCASAGGSSAAGATSGSEPGGAGGAEGSSAAVARSTSTGPLASAPSATSDGPSSGSASAESQAGLEASGEPLAGVSLPRGGLAGLAPGLPGAAALCALRARHLLAIHSGSVVPKKRAGHASRLIRKLRGGGASSGGVVGWARPEPVVVPPRRPRAPRTSAASWSAGAPPLSACSARPPGRCPTETAHRHGRGERLVDGSKAECRAATCRDAAEGAAARATLVLQWAQGSLSERCATVFNDRKRLANLAGHSYAQPHRSLGSLSGHFGAFLRRGRRYEAFRVASM
jgi:hypothetical protein